MDKTVMHFVFLIILLKLVSAQQKKYTMFREQASGRYLSNGQYARVTGSGNDFLFDPQMNEQNQTILYTYSRPSDNKKKFMEILGGCKMGSTVGSATDFKNMPNQLWILGSDGFIGSVCNSTWFLSDDPLGKQIIIEKQKHTNPRKLQWEQYKRGSYTFGRGQHTIRRSGPSRL